MRWFPKAPRDFAPLRLCVMSLFTALQAAACSHPPPADFAPDPGLVAQIRAIRIIVGLGGACPGATIPATYEAVLADGTPVPFARSYDKNHPPRLHVVFLDRESPDAVPRADGDWVTERDPLATVSTGFRLTATLRAKPSVVSTVVVPPDYGCMPHRFAFSGAPGGAAGLDGGDGPDVTIRLAMLRSLFSYKLYVAAIQVGAARPFYVLRDANSAPPTDWLVVQSQGGAAASPSSFPKISHSSRRWWTVAAGVGPGDREDPVGPEVGEVRAARDCSTRTISPAPTAPTGRRAMTGLQVGSGAKEDHGRARSSGHPRGTCSAFRRLPAWRPCSRGCNAGPSARWARVLATSHRMSARRDLNPGPSGPKSIGFCQ